ncbi:TRAP transporter small permease [Teichococcus oryzae]|uniref:TRAP transporter small permease protein n=1 Tax=Teichococcus oryzae TaxID=1608942 RepID=A0A5B2TJS2_9PROT|nr:TRAP transporter small permease [Pseudoroseomonas oryzae]KAA2214010.1 TRAP transporter small permease [Pseudoroseomonas oryzae]
MAAGDFAQGCRSALGLCCNICLGIAAVSLVAMTFVVAWAVFGRFVLNDTPAWADVVAMLLMGWVILGAAAAGVREGFHMGFDTLKEALPAPLRKLCDAVSDLVVMLFGLGMAWFAADLAMGVWDATLPAIGLPGAVEYLPLVIGGLMIALFGLERLAAHLSGAEAPADSAAAPLVSDA